MITNGIIAEYNPFHNGHKYQLEEARQATGADFTIVVMSGDFVQRGAPAILDKYRRAEMALRNGADLVLELPVYYATGSAEYFAAGAVSLLDKLGVVDHLCFGSECGDLALLQRAASLLAEEPEDYAILLKEYLRSGYTFPAARIRALSEYDKTFAENESLLSSPNNILAIEYLKAIAARKSNMQPHTVKRNGAGYHDTDPNSQYASATAIRQQLLNNCTASLSMPHSAFEILQQCYPEDSSQDFYPFLTSDDFSSMLHYKLLSENDREFTDYLDVSQELSDRILNKIYDFNGFDGFSDILKSKELTHTRISRSLFHILLGITEKNMQLYRSWDDILYARVLGLRKSASPLLHAIKMQARIPFITKLADAEQILSSFYEDQQQFQTALQMLREDISASHIYESAVSMKTRRSMLNEYRTSIVIL